jgi:uncharacterized damage-inducible protein DinB
MLAELQQLLRYSEWTDAEFFARCANADEKLRKQTHHMTFVQNAFLDVLQQKEFVFPDPNALSPPIQDLQMKCQDNYSRMMAYLNSLTESDLNERVHIPWFPGQLKLNIGEALLQVVMHTQHHRGQNLEYIHRSAAGKSSPIDWIVWIYKGKPAANWGQRTE